MSLFLAMDGGEGFGVGNCSGSQLVITLHVTKPADLEKVQWCAFKSSEWKLRMNTCDSSACSITDGGKTVKIKPDGLTGGKLIKDSNCIHVCLYVLFSVKGQIPVDTFERILYSVFINVHVKTVRMVRMSILGSDSQHCILGNFKFALNVIGRFVLPPQWTTDPYTHSCPGRQKRSPDHVEGASVIVNRLYERDITATKSDESQLSCAATGFCLSCLWVTCQKDKLNITLRFSQEIKTLDNVQIAVNSAGE